MPEEPQDRPRPGDLADVIITYAAPHHLNADGGLLALHRTRGGDAWQDRRSVPGRSAIDLGIPTVGVPGTLQPAQTCPAH